MRSYDTCIHAVVLTSLPPQPGCNKVPYGKFDTKQCPNCEHYEPIYPGADKEPIVTQTDCKKCIYCTNEEGYVDNDGCYHGVSYRNKWWCKLNLRTTKPICPLFDDGKEVKE